MKKFWAVFILVIFTAAAPALAKNQSAGKGKSPAESKGYESTVKAKAGKSAEVTKEKAGKAKTETEEAAGLQEDDLKGLEKQRAKKSEQVQKEVDKGSEQGQEARQQRRKWWRFWE